MKNMSNKPKAITEEVRTVSDNIHASMSMRAPQPDIKIELLNE